MDLRHRVGVSCARCLARNRITGCN